MSAPVSASSLVESRFVDYFVICGLDIDSGLEPDRFAGDNLHYSPLDRPYKGKILGHYPEKVSSNVFDEHAVCMLCLPAGLLFRTQKHVLDPKFHSFVVTREDASRYYGFSLVFYEEVRNRNICNAMHTLQAMHITELSSGQTPPGHRKSGPRETCRSLPRSFKLSPHMSGAAVSYYDIAKDKLYVAKSIALISQLPYVRVAHLFLLNLFKSLPRQPGPGLSPESYVYNMLYEVVLPPPGQSIRFYLPPPEPHLPPISTVIHRPCLPDEFPLLDFPLREVFTLLGADYIIQLFTCVLLENQVLLRSSDCNRLMLVAECVTALLFPFCWAHVYVPILPSPLYHFLDAPVPFVMGLHSEISPSSLNNVNSNMCRSGIGVGSEAALCLVDIDKPNIQLPEELPIFPYRNAFLEELSNLIDKYQIPKPPHEQLKYHTPMNGFTQKYYNPDPMSSSCTLPSGGGVRRKHSFNDILDWEESRPLSGSPPPSPPPHSIFHSNRVTPPRSDALQRIVDIARRTGVNIDDLDSEDVMPTARRKKLSEEEQYEEDIKFNNSVRETFLNRFVHMFSSYEHFVILPDQDKESWLSNRDTMQNFDKAAFLSDQPEHHRPFLSRFLESQMFATFIDNKIMSTWGDVDSGLELFDNKIKLLRKRYGGDSLPVRSACYEPCLTTRNYLPSSFFEADERPPPSELMPHRAAYYRAFPLLDSKMLEQAAPTSADRTSSLRRKNGNFKWQSKEIPTDNINSELGRKLSTETTPAAIAQSNKTFVEKLLKDCKSKTKKMLLEKMGTEAVDLGLGVEVSVVGVEENTMIASLCDLLERIWAHGLQHKFGKSALWMHLKNYQELEQCNDTSKPIDPNFLTPDLSSVALESEAAPQKTQTPNRSRDSSRASSRDSSRDRLGSGSNTLERKPSNPVPLRPLPENLTFDMRNIQAMSDIKTEIGYARAWVRLSLEKKLLSKHLKTLLSDTALLKSQYKRTAFLRCEEEREQFLYHLLTLNAVDYHCFTNTYPLTKLPYRMVIVPSRKASATTANCWVSVSGTNGETQQIPIPKNTLEFVFHHKNLGILTTLRIGHDNSGLSPRWMLESVYVRNEVTGHTYRFPCNRWLGRGVDDGSTERLLVAQALHNNSKQCNSGVGSNASTLERPPKDKSSLPPPSPGTPHTTHLSPSTIQHMIGDCVNAIVKWHYRSKRDKDVSSLSVLLCGENGLVKCLEQAFLCGFKCTRLFGRNLFIWDYFVRVKEVFEQNLSEECSDSASDTSSGVYSYNSPSHSLNRSQEHSTIWRCYCHLMDEINNAGRTVGKDGKFQIFICLSLREHWLHRMLVPMSQTRVTLEMYEEQSFMRKRGLLTFLRQILEPLDEFNIVLENSITQGILSYN